MENYQEEQEEKEGKKEVEEIPGQEETDTPPTWFMEYMENYEDKMAALALDIMIENRLEA